MRLRTAPRASRAPFSDRFSRPGTRGVVQRLTTVSSPPGRCVSGSRLHRRPFPWGLAPCPIRRCCGRGVRHLGLCGFTPRKQDPPIVSRTFQSFGALRNLPCADRRIMREVRVGRIDFLRSAENTGPEGRNLWDRGKQCPPLARNGHSAIHRHPAGIRRYPPLLCVQRACSRARRTHPKVALQRFGIGGQHAECITQPVEQRALLVGYGAPLKGLRDGGLIDL